MSSFLAITVYLKACITKWSWHTLIDYARFGRGTEENHKNLGIVGANNKIQTGNLPNTSLKPCLFTLLA
jgi:hypothetical protein